MNILDKKNKNECEPCTVKTVRTVHQQSLPHGAIWQNCSIHISKIIV